MERFTFLGEMYNDGMPLGLTAAIARNFAAYNRLSLLGATDSDRPEGKNGDSSDADRRKIVDLTYDRLLQ